jgi:hypothetical protein
LGDLLSARISSADSMMCPVDAGRHAAQVLGDGLEVSHNQQANIT